MNATPHILSQATSRGRSAFLCVLVALAFLFGQALTVSHSHDQVVTAEDPISWGYVHAALDHAYHDHSHHHGPEIPDQPADPHPAACDICLIATRGEDETASPDPDQTSEPGLTQPFVHIRSVLTPTGSDPLSSGPACTYRPILISAPQRAPGLVRAPPTLSA